MHIWWECSKITKFWDEIHFWAGKLTGYTESKSPGMYLLHHTPIAVPRYKRSLCINLINVARTLISCHWKSQDATSLGQWWNAVNSILNMEEAGATSQDRIDDFRETWAPWNDIHMHIA